jgi:predicted RNA polymerase sigma factor
VGRARGAATGLALLDSGVADAPYADAVRGALLEELGRDGEAVEAFERAAGAARNGHEARQLRERAARLRERERS